MEDKRGVFSPPQVLKSPSLPHSWPCFNLQQIRAAGNRERTPFFFFFFPPAWAFTLSLLCGITTTKSQKAVIGGKELSMQGDLVVALKQLVVNKPVSNYGTAVMDQAWRSVTMVPRQLFAQKF